MSDKCCAHCNTKLNKNALYDEDLNAYFCCEGCRAVYQIINQEGFSSYYDKRIGWTEGAVSRVEVSEESFEPIVKHLTDGNDEVSIVISGMRCAACVWLLENSAIKDERIKSFRINYANHKAKFVFDPKKISLKEVLDKVTRLGYCPLPLSQIETLQDKERKDYFYRFAVAVFFTMQVMMYTVATYTGYFQGMEKSLYTSFQIISGVLALPVILYSAYPFFKNALIGLKRFHFSMDTLVAIGVGTAYIYSIFAIIRGGEVYFDTSVMITTLILLGRFIESGAKQRGSNAILKLQSLTPATVKKVIDDNYESIESITFVVTPINDIKKGDIIILDSNENIPCDGKVIKGELEVNEAMLTGEPLPVMKNASSQVYAGTQAINGKAIVEVESAKDTLLSKIAEAMDEAASSKAKIQDMADRVVGFFVPIVLIICLLTFLGYILFTDIGIEGAIMRSVAVLVIACPCAMGLATPLAIISTSNKLVEAGIIFKSGEAIEHFARIKDIFFDKTGTITYGELKLIRQVAFIDEEAEAIKLIASLAFRSNHPASKAISSSYDGTLLQVENYTEVAGKGTEAIIEGRKVRLGSLNYISETAVVKEESAMQDEGVLSYASIDGKLAYGFALQDTLRENAEKAIDLLLNEHLSVTILTGDTMKSSNAVLGNIAEKVEVRAELTPFEKSEMIKEKKEVCMVGDGINDAIALTSASIGIAMRSGSDISMESAGAVLLRNDLTLIAKGYRISKKALRIIKQNLFWAFSYNIIAIPLAITGLIHPVMSAAFMAFSSILVVSNSFRQNKG